MNKNETGKLAFRHSSYKADNAERLIGADIWKKYQKLRDAQKAKIDIERNTIFSQLATELKSKQPLRTLVLEGTDPASREELFRRMFTDRKLSRGRGTPRTALYDDPWFLSRPLGVPDCFFDHHDSYNLATPDPEYIVDTPADTYKGIGATEIEAYASASNGNISVGFSGGNWLGNDGEPFFSSQLPNYPNALFPCDGLSTSGRVFDLTDLATTPSQPPWQPTDNLVVTASVRCAVKNGDPLYRNLSVRPGASSSPASGLIMLTAYLNLTMSYVTGGEIVQSGTNSSVVIQLAANSGPGAYGQAVNIFVDQDEFLNPANPAQVVSSSVSLPLVDSLPDYLLTEVEVELVGLRAGHNAPQAGYIAMSFQDWSPGTITTIYGLSGAPCPFQVVEISACVRA